VCGRGGGASVAAQMLPRGGAGRRRAGRTPPGRATVAVRLGVAGVPTRLAGGGGSRRVEQKGVLLPFFVLCCSVPPRRTCPWLRQTPVVRTFYRCDAGGEKESMENPGRLTIWVTPTRGWESDEYSGGDSWRHKRCVVSGKCRARTHIRHVQAANACSIEACTSRE